MKILFLKREASRLLPSAFCLLFAGCTPTVQVKHVMPAEPLKVDVSMTVDVYQRGEPGGSTQHKLSDEESQALRRRDERSGQVWAMKNDGVIVENKNGYLDAQTKSGWDPKEVAKLAADENRDRRVLYEAEALASARPVAVIEEEAGKRLRQQAYGRKPEPNPETSKP